MTRRRIILPILVLAALTGRASAAQVTLTNQWQNLGNGPLLISVLNGDGMFEASATTPTDSGLPIFRNQQPFAFNATLPIWGRSRSSSSTPIATYTPIVVGGGSGGGSVTQGTSPWADNVTQFGGTNVVTGTGASGAGIPRFTFSNDSAIANTAFGISGTLPAFAQTPTFNLGTLNGAATAVNQTNVESASGTAAGTLLGIQGGGSGALPVLAQLGAGSATIGSVTVLQGGAANTSGNPFFVTLTNPAPTTVTSNQGTPAAVANAWPTYLTQGGSILSTTNPIFEQTVGPSMQAPGTAPTIVRGIQGATAGIPVNMNTQQLAGTVLGAPSAYGTAPASGAIVPGVNASVTASVLPTGAATAANQNVTAAGTSATNAQAIQGVSGGVAVPTVSVGGSINPYGLYNTVLPTIGGGNTSPIQLDVRGQTKTSETGSSDPLVGIVPAITQSGTSDVGKTSAGNLYSAYAVNTTTTAGYLACINATAAPAASAAIAPIDVATLSGTVGATAQLNYGAGPPNAYSTGVTCLITTSLTTYTAGGNAFMQVRTR